jgi:hypothetical protein
MVTFDPAAPDMFPDPNAVSIVTSGSISLAFPEVGLSFTSTSPIGITAYNDSALIPPFDELQANGNVNGGFTGNLGGHAPFALGLSFFGDTSMLAADMLPDASLNWNFGNLHLNFDIATAPRDLFIGFEPVPLPAAAWLLAPALLGLAGAARNRAGPGAGELKR